jgi:hypothetical protein
MYADYADAFWISNIITHHAEDGSGVGSAIIAGKLRIAYLYFAAHPET